MTSKKKFKHYLSKKYIPNYLTILRLLFLIPFIIIFSLQTASLINPVTSMSINLIIFALAMFTDYLDGYLARRWKVVSTFGKLFDPLADKIMISSTLIFLGALNYSFIWLAILFIVRDLIVDGSRNLMASKKIDLGASIWGKLKTVLQTLGIIIIFIVSIIFIAKNISFDGWIWLINAVLFLALIASYLSGWLYIKKIIPFFA